MLTTIYYRQLTIEKISYSLHVDLKIRYFDVKFHVLFHAEYVVEYVFNYSGDDTLPLWVS